MTQAFWLMLLTALSLGSAYDNGAPNSRLPALGWSSWVALGPGANHPVFDYCDEFSVMSAVDAFHEVGLYAAGYRHFHLDDCWAGGRNASGFLYPEVDHFPNGMAPVVAYAHSKNLTFGLYTCAGTFTCVGGRPGSKGHWDQDAQVFAQWGVDWVKMDWCNTDGMVPQEAYGNMSAALNRTGRAMHLNMCEWGLDGPWNWGGKIAQSWRSTRDHVGRWDDTALKIKLSAALPRNATGRPYGWNDMDMLETGNYEQAAHANGKESNMTLEEYKTEFSMWAISASPLVVTTPIMNCTAEKLPGKCSVELSTQKSKAACVEGSNFGCYSDTDEMWIDAGCRGVFACNGVSTTCDIDGGGRHNCTCGKPVCQGWISEIQKTILLNTEVIAVQQDVTPQGRPLAAPQFLPPGSKGAAWLRNLSDGSVAIAFYNEADPGDPAQILPGIGIAVDFSSIPGWDPTTEVRARDLWDHMDYPGSFTGRYPPPGFFQFVQPHSTSLVRLTKVAPIDGNTTLAAEAAAAPPLPLAHHNWIHRPATATAA